MATIRDAVNTRESGTVAAATVHVDRYAPAERIAPGVLLQRRRLNFDELVREELSKPFRAGDFVVMHFDDGSCVRLDASELARQE